MVNDLGDNRERKGCDVSNGAQINGTARDIVSRKQFHYFPGLLLAGPAGTTVRT